MTYYRYCTLAAVSDEQQAVEGRDSIPHQLKVTREYGERMGGEFIGEYVADGYSRSGYFDLTSAFANIPEFARLAKDARAHLFDVVLVESFDRFGDLGFNWFNYFASLGAPFIQMRSVQQPLPIDDPSTYHPRRDDSITMMLGNSAVINKYRTNKIFRAFIIGNSRRARDGKPSIRIPYGYIKKDKDTAIVDDAVAPLIQKFAAWYLEGKTMGEIVNLANATGITPRKTGKWSHNIILYILKNPFYAGLTFYGRGYNDNTGYHLRSDFTDFHKGNHEPLWSVETYERLRSEITRRKQHRHECIDYNLTRQLICSECGNVLRISYSTKTPHNKSWYCLNGHVRISVESANQQVADELIRLYKDKEYHPSEEEKTNNARQIRAKENELRRLDEAYKHGSHTPQDYAEERRKILSQLDDLRNEDRQKEEEERRKKSRGQMVASMKDILPYIREWISTEEPHIVKFHLSQVVKLTAYPDKTIKAEYANR